MLNPRLKGCKIHSDRGRQYTSEPYLLDILYQRTIKQQKSIVKRKEQKMTAKLNKSLTNFYNYKGVKFEEYTIELKDNKIIGCPIIKHDSKINIVNNV